LRYDQLVIASGEQYCADNISDEFSQIDGVREMNSLTAYNLKQIVQKAIQQENHVIVYGGDLQAYCLVNGNLTIAK
jgi:pyruvate/2-oxoglutarate/acetoin dehydrogenase E1 component